MHFTWLYILRYYNYCFAERPKRKESELIEAKVKPRIRVRKSVLNDSSSSSSLETIHEFEDEYDSEDENQNLIKLNEPCLINVVEYLNLEQ